MKTKTIEVVVQPDGKLQMEAFNFAGADCEKATKFLEQALGWRTSQERKPDYYRANTLKARPRQQLGGGDS